MELNWGRNSKCHDTIGSRAAIWAALGPLNEWVGMHSSAHAQTSFGREPAVTQPGDPANPLMPAHPAVNVKPAGASRLAKLACSAFRCGRSSHSGMTTCRSARLRRSPYGTTSSQKWSSKRRSSYTDVCICSRTVLIDRCEIGTHPFFVVIHVADTTLIAVKDTLRLPQSCPFDTAGSWSLSLSTVWRVSQALTCAVISVQGSPAGNPVPPNTYQPMLCPRLHCLW